LEEAIGFQEQLGQKRGRELISIPEQEHNIGGLFVKEVGPPLPTSFSTPILMVHGVSHGWWAFQNWLNFFAVFGWSSFSMSLRNHEGSYTVPKKAYLRLSLENYVQDVLQVLRWIGLPAVLMGHSMGGIIAQLVAERVELRALVLVASVGPGQLGPTREPLPTDRPFMLTPQEARQVWFHRIAQEDFQEFYKRLVPESPSAMNDYSLGRIRIQRQRISCPILVVGAQHDRTVVHPFERIADFYGCESLLVPDAGHDMMLEPMALDAAVAINRWLLEKLRDQGLSTRPPREL
jgi:pimeloyl-ACP methyl ester carboxylesterase